MYGRIANTRSVLNGLKWRALRLRQIARVQCIHSSLPSCCAASRFSLEHNLPSSDVFPHRHIGPDLPEQKEMLRALDLEVSLVSLCFREMSRCDKYIHSSTHSAVPLNCQNCVAYLFYQ